MTEPSPRSRARWLPSRALVLGATVPLGLSLGALVDAHVGFAVLALDGALAIAGGIDALRVPRGAITVSRTCPDVFSVGRPNAVSLEVHNRSARTLRVRITQDLFDGASAPELPLEIELAPHATTTLKYTVRPERRGTFVLGDHVLRVHARGGLAIRQERIVASDTVRVYPDVMALRQYDQWARRGQALLAGSLRTRGGESEFERLRPYVQGDEQRTVDWRATARRRSLTVRQFQTETQQHVVAVLDCGRTMRAESRGLALLDHALNATLMLAHVAVSRGDWVGMLAFDDAVRVQFAPRGGATAERRLVRAVFDLEARLAESDFTLVQRVLRASLQRRTLVVIFTQVLDEGAGKRVAVLARSLLPRHLPLVVMLRDRDVDALANDPVREPHDLYVRAAAADALAAREKLVREMQGAGVLVLDVFPEQATPDLLRRYVDIKARRLL